MGGYACSLFPICILHPFLLFSADGQPFQHHLRYTTHAACDLWPGPYVTSNANNGVSYIPVKQDADSVSLCSLTPALQRRRWPRRSLVRGNAPSHLELSGYCLQHKSPAHGAIAVKYVKGEYYYKVEEGRSERGDQ